MMTRTIKTLIAVTMMLTTASAFGQDHRTNNGCAAGGCRLPNSDFDYRDTRYNLPVNDMLPYDHAASSQWDPRDDRTDRSMNRYQSPLSDSLSRADHLFRNRYPDSSDRGYGDYRSRLDNAVEDTFRAPIPEKYPRRGETRDWRSDRRNLPSDFERTNYRERLPDPFRLPSMSNTDQRRYRTTPLSRDNFQDQSRYRIPLDQVDYSAPRNDYLRDQVPFDRRPARDYRNPTDSPQPSIDRTRGGYDPLTPPLPRRDSGNSETEAIFKGITARYGNPASVRAIRSLSSTQALRLFQEVNQQTDQRHLEPSSYDLRIRRGLRNLSLALENESFARSVGVSADSFRVDGFRTTLSRIAEQMRINDLNDAQNVVQTVMREAQNVPGLAPNVVAFEFANATVDTLDKFSALEPKEPGQGASLDIQQKNQTKSAGLETEMVGIGVELKVHEQGLLIMKALRGGPAADAGLQSGDLITAINQRSIAGMTMANSVDMMKGGNGGSVRLSISRDGGRSSDVTLSRRRFRLYTVNDSKMLQGTRKVAYVNLSQFGPKSTEELDQALTSMYQQGMQSLILDLRGNPGGLLNVCVDITNRFLPCGTIVSTRGRLSSDNMKETATFSRTWSTPIVVLIDGDSASASEIFAAAIQDNRRGVVVGEKSYGKGTVQTHFPLGSINGNLRLTTARFYSPNGKAMSGAGVTPDVRVADSDGPANGDLALRKAIEIAQGQRIRDIAEAAKQCRPRTGQIEDLQKNSFRNDMFDSIAPVTVLR